MLQYKAHFNNIYISIGKQRNIYPLVNNVSFISYTCKCYNTKHISITIYIHWHISIKYISIGNNVSFISYTFKCYNTKHISIKYISIGKQRFVHSICI